MTIDAKILNALRAADDGAVSGADLAQQLGVSRAAVWARIEDLRSLGYEIEASPHRGYRLLSAPDVLHADDLASRLGRTKVIGREIHVFEQTTSTMDVVEKFARDGLKEGVVVFAESQTKGRGRLEMGTSLKAEIKWPNDLLIGGKKVVGILTELSAELDQVKYVILGIGVDVNLNASEFPSELRKIATSLKIELGKSVSRAELAVTILRELDRDYARIMSGHFSEVGDEWEEHCSTIGRDVVIRTGEREIRGHAESLGEEGALLVRTDHGHLERITGGDVTMQKQT